MKIMPDIITNSGFFDWKTSRGPVDQKPDPYHVHPRHKRTVKPRESKPLFQPLKSLAAGTSRARKGETYRANGRVPRKIPTVYKPLQDRNKYSGKKLREIRAAKGVGGPV